MQSKPIRAKTRTVTRTVRVAEDRCVVCATWTVRTGNSPRVTCSDSCRTALYRMRRKGERPTYAV